jgi:hypothetical protein
MKTSLARTNNQFLFTGTLSTTQFLSLVHVIRHRWIVLTTAGFILFLLIGNLYAQPIYVTASSAQYLTYVRVDQPTGTGPDNIVTRTTTSPNPISDEIDLPVLVVFGQGAITHAIANAGLFNVSDQTGWGFAQAEAVSQLWFSPLADQTQTLTIQILADGRMGDPAYTSGQISLFDLTANSEVWGYNWDYAGSIYFPVPVSSGGSIPGDFLSSGTADFSLDTDFLASHQYELTLLVGSAAGDDSEMVQIQLAGLQLVPEPSGVCLLVLAVLGLSTARHKIRRDKPTVSYRQVRAEPSHCEL